MDHQGYLAKVRAKGRITVVGATADELATIKSALNLYRTRNEEKHTNNPGMGWGKAAESAEEISIRMEPY